MLFNYTTCFALLAFCYAKLVNESINQLVVEGSAWTNKRNMHRN